ncbi:helix-turn-helix domain-containing protein [Dokdonella soli]|uniref:HTH cro/C1-type domain-containing protein n=1 Tax=Dokdonella soli TaxID=529810 RepID=A0ABN1IHB6_9GAMM
MKADNIAGASDAVQSIGQRLRALRNEHAWLLEEAAAHIGISAQYLCRLERGHYQNPTMHLLVSIADAYGTSVDFICGRNVAR